DQQDPMERFFRFFGGQPTPDDQERHGLGSGFLIGNGMVLTNNHVVEIQDPGSNKFRPMDDIKVITDETSPVGAREYVGEVIGVNTAIIGGANTIGFAIPIAVVKQILPQLEKNGRVMRGFLGVQPQPITQDMVDTLGLKSTQGALIADVVKGSPADKAGVKPGDVVVSLSGKPVTDGNQLTRDVGTIPPR